MLRNLTKGIWLIPIVLVFIVNQYTWMAFFDIDGYLAYEQKLKFWLLDALLMLLALLLYLQRGGISDALLQIIQTKGGTKVILITFTLFVVVDTTVVREYAKVTQSHFFVDEKTARAPAPYVGFSGQPNAGNHNDDGFLGRSIKEARPGILRIAFFGGSTGYFGDPTIAEGIEEYLGSRGVRADVYNFSVVSSNHRQHLHSLVENVLPYGADVVIFFGGYNETIQHGFYDPRPGYPYNFFFRDEAGTWVKALMTLSGTAQLFERATGLLTGLNRLRTQQGVFSAEWKERLVEKYLETLSLARKVSLTMTPITLAKPHFLAFYQPYRVSDQFLDVHKEIRTRAGETDYFSDVSTAYDDLGKEVFVDIVHVKQAAKDVMAATLAQILLSSVRQCDRQRRLTR
jgi:hypothetical protein